MTGSDSNKALIPTFQNSKNGNLTKNRTAKIQNDRPQNRIETKSFSLKPKRESVRVPTSLLPFRSF
ncbi:hypothetical protein A0128_19655 [Leptospira tipperaryensis]|uniref:Uncharacterized protein n=1 Tax=Leptospira tipperaryensis TaxID=2564040 RepID=A0A1D7V324_9LEPT|nr:hypothetical protein A0128_19655 [Leptospira tipperaryensis]